MSKPYYAIQAVEAASLHFLIEKIAIRSIGVNEELYLRLQSILARSELRVIRKQLLARVSPWIPQFQPFEEVLPKSQPEKVDCPEEIEGVPVHEMEVNNSRFVGRFVRIVGSWATSGCSLDHICLITRFLVCADASFTYHIDIYCACHESFRRLQCSHHDFRFLDKAPDLKLLNKKYGWLCYLGNCTPEEYFEECVRLEIAGG